MKKLSATPNRRISYQPRLTPVAAALLVAGIGAAPLALPTAAYAQVVTVANPARSSRNTISGIAKLTPRRPQRNGTHWMLTTDGFSCRTTR